MILSGLLAVCCGDSVIAGPDVGVIDGDAVTFTGDQSAGVVSGVDFLTPPITTLHVHSLSSVIDPAAGTVGVSFLNTEGGGITINSGQASANVIINVEGADAIGICAVSEGAPASYEWLAGLGVWAPFGSSGAGGPVEVVSYSDITTNGDSAHGIVAQNKIGIYSSESTSTLSEFSMNDVDISLTSVAGSAGNIDAPVAGDNGGIFTLHGDGTWSFDASDFNDVLEVGETAVTKVEYEVEILHDPADDPYGSQSSAGSFAMNVTKTGDGVFETVPAIYFEEFDQFSDPAGAAPLWPDLEGYVEALLGDMGIAGAGESISITSAGAITTYGTSSHGVFAETEGGRGLAGTSGTFFDAGKIPTPGGPGSNGGAVTIISNGDDIVTYGESSGGIAVLSRGGTGGNGGNGGPWRYGARGGTGGTGGEVMIQGSGEIYTFGEYSSGIIALSEGGPGGTGGSGAGVTGGGNGGFGGKGGDVGVVGSWDITTAGHKAHGIWAKSVGGSAGAGGSGGWLFGKPGSGGEASDGGTVTVDSSGVITTYGDDAYGIYGESIGGFGGSGGTTFGLFWAFGGDAGSAGSGGDVVIANQAGGDVTTHDLESHAIFGQSVGGGGGSGGGMFGLIYSLGGEGGSGGNGGWADVSNAALIQTHGIGARGIYAQSVGGGGGDGGWSVGVVAMGGSGSETSHGGNVAVANSGDIATGGDSADAVFAQSIGGGGGNSGALGGLVSIGGTGSGGGDGRDVEVENSGNLSTAGLVSRAIVAQSIGGGGGDGTTTGGMLVDVGSSGGGGGDGGVVGVTNSGMIETTDEDSTAIFAQSLGGGGGNVASLDEVTAADPDDALAVSLGGDGGSSGDGSTVAVVNSGTIVTESNRSQGILAQSVGGGGGTAGGSNSWVWSVGGDGGSSGNGGTVSVANSGRIETSGDASDAITAQSTGGGGGVGSGETDDTSVPGGGSGFSIAYSYGGNGGSAGDGGDAEVTNSGELITSGDGSRGIFAQSLGGGGGKGEISSALAVSLGGDGGSSGIGSNVTVENTGAITTFGDNADGIFAQSVGGGGGSTSTAGHSAWSFFCSTGGKGAAGGNAGAIELTTSGRIETHGMYSSGVVAQSIGGGGGSASDVKTISPGIVIEIGTAVGGNGGAGGDGNSVTINSSSDIIIHGENSHGIVAQSVGNGGGSAGSATIWSVVALNDLLDLANMSISALFSIGGDAGGTGDGGAVDVENSGSITTSAFNSYGILAQSIGGGGGNGGNGSIFAGAYNGDHSINLALGGKGGAGGDGGVVDVNSGGAVTTQGDHSPGIIAQSIGGGGGAGGDAKVVSINLDLWVPDSPDDLLDLTQNVDFTASLGGSGGASGVGRAVNVVNSGTISTEGAFSSGILAQSVGGGGGAGGHSSSYEVEVGDPISTFTSLFMEIEYDFILGGNGGGGGNASHVTVTNSGDIATTGPFGVGILAQSVGGCGGAGGNVLTFKYNGVEAIAEIVQELIDFGSTSMVLQGTGGAGGDGGNVTVTNSSNIATEGAFAHGIFAQSVGGGGGFAGMSDILDISSLSFGSGANGTSSQSSGAGVSFAGSLGATGSAGNVTVTQTGDITTQGNAAHGIFAQSASGVWLSASGAVTVTLDGDITAEGVGSDGILAQSIGGTSGIGNISVNVLDGIIQGGSGAGAGVHIDGGVNNRLTNAGDISSLSGMAITGGSGNERIDNYGTVTGNANLGAGGNSFNNLSGAMFNAGPVVNLGGGRLTNSGTLSPGGSGAIIAADLTGRVTQTSSGVFAVDLDLYAEQVDRLDVSGTSSMAGQSRIDILDPDPGWVVPGTWSATILSSAGGVTDSGLSLLTQPSAVVEYELLWPNATDVDLQTSIDFSPDRGLTRNQRAIGEAVNRIQSAGSSETFAPFAAELFWLPDVESLGAAYDQLSPESYDAGTTTTIEVTQQYTQTLAKRMHSTRSYIDSTGSTPRADRTPQHAAWLDGFGQWADQDANDGFTGYDYHVGGVAFGLDYLLSDGCLLGVSYGRSSTNIDLDGNNGSGNIVSDFVSLYGSCFDDRMYLDGAIGYGRQSYDNKRHLEVGELTQTARSDHDGDAYSAFAEAGYNCGSEKCILQPFGSLQYVYLDEDSFREHGADGANLLVEGRQIDSLVSQLGARFFRPFRSGSWDFIPGVSVAWRHDFDIDDRHVTAAFDGSPGVAFSTESRDIDKDGAIVSTDMTLMNRAGFSISLKYSSEFRSDYNAHVLHGGLRYEF